MKRALTYLVLITSLISVSGCGGTRPVPGGTAGILLVGGQPISEIQVTLYQPQGSNFEPVGFGVTDVDGMFRLYQNGAQGSLWLPPGEYRYTVESIGPPIQFPSEYLSATATPCKFTWTGNEAELELNVPAPGR